MEVTLQILVGKTFIKVEKSPPPKRREDSLNDDSPDEIIFTVSDDEKYKLYHRQDCCELVNIEDICGELGDLVGVPLLQAEESSSEKDPEGYKREYNPESVTWTFYRFATIKGSVVIRWRGESNGYYSERVDFAKI